MEHTDNRPMPPLASYLSGEAFSADLSFRPAIIGHAQARGDWLVQAVAQRRVLHVGFADHVPLIAQRVADGSWLHARVSRSASACWGIDINPEAVQVARSLGFDNVQQLDIFSAEAPAALQHQAPDVVLVPDVIEHLSDPAAFLRRLRLCLPQAQFLVSVPNGLSLRNACHTLRGREQINTDHRAWFSPFTLLKVLADAGLACDALHACQVVRPGTLAGHVLAAAVRWRPLGADVLVASARAASPARLNAPQNP